jgi:hypothetical protein
VREHLHTARAYGCASLGRRRPMMPRHICPAHMAWSAACATMLGHGRTDDEGASSTGVWDERVAQPAMGLKAVGAWRGNPQVCDRGRSPDNEQPCYFVARRSWGWVHKHKGVGILFFVWGPLLGSRVRTGVTDGRQSWIIINEQISYPVSNDEKTYQF